MNNNISVISIQTDDDYLENLRIPLKSFGVERFFKLESVEQAEEVKKRESCAFIGIRGTPSGYIDWDYFFRVIETCSHISVVEVAANDGNSDTPLILLDEKGKLIKKGTLGEQYVDGFREIGISFYRNTFDNAHEITYLPMGQSPCPLPLDLKGALFLDRDGIINVDIGYESKFTKFTMVDAAVDLIKLANEKKCEVFVITNQSGIARGLFSEDELRRLHNDMNQYLLERGAKVGRWLYCPYHRVKNGGCYDLISLCRKPSPGMIMRAFDHSPFSIPRSLVLGDKITDHLNQPLLESWHLWGRYDLSDCPWRVFTSWKEIQTALRGWG